MCFLVGGGIVSYLDTETGSRPAVRHTKCSILVPKTKKRCLQCTAYRRTLTILAKRKQQANPEERSDPQSHKNYRYLSSPDKMERLRKLHQLYRKTSKQLDRLKVSLANAIEQQGVDVGSSLDDDLHSIMVQDYFQRLFWQQQLNAASKKSPKGMKWHPMMMIRWCLYLRHHSGRTYEALRYSGVISLPSQRTLRDYTHCVQACSGFSAEVDEHLSAAMKLASCKDHEKQVVLLLDEMHARENLVFEKHEGSLIGFANIGDVNTHLLAFEN